jgi:hypothetical protein
MKLLALCFEAMGCSSKTGKLIEGRNVKVAGRYRRYCERRCHCSDLFAPVIKANSWLSLVSQGGNPILLEDGNFIVVVRKNGSRYMPFI